MFTRCRFASQLSKKASTSQIISRPCPRIPSSSREPNSSSIRRFSKGASIRQESPVQWTTESWDDIFKDLDNQPVQPRKTMAKKHPIPEPRASDESQMPYFPRPTQRQTLTKREQDALSEMVDMILQPESQKTNTQDNEPVEQTGSQVNSLVNRLRQYSRKQRKALPSDEMLDKKLEEISLFTTDVELLEWAAREVFGESMRLAEQASAAMADASRTGMVADLPLLQSPLYSSLIAHLMRTFRVQYHDPHLALSIFDHAKNLSTLSFVFGCSTGAYNELIEAQWMISHDFEMIHTYVEEMFANGVSPDGKTRRLIEKFRQENFQNQAPATSNQAHNMDFLTKIEQLFRPTQRLKASRYEEWKSGTLPSFDMETFGDWGTEGKQQDEQERTSPNTTFDNELYNRSI